MSLFSLEEEWMTGIVDAIAPFASLFKPQRAYYESITDGEKALRLIIQHIHKNHPGIPVVLDCKRGDIDRTQGRYMEAHFGRDRVDGMNFSPYMGSGCMSNLVDPKYPDKAIVGLCRTSNPDAWQVQDVFLKSGERYWEYMAMMILDWAEAISKEHPWVIRNAGLVMGAAHKKSLLARYPKLHPDVDEGDDGIYSFPLVRVREIVGNKLWFLIPGIGTQGGFVEETIRCAYMGPGSVAINSSSGIIFASTGDDYMEAAAKAAETLRDQIRVVTKAA